MIDQHSTLTAQNISFIFAVTPLFKNISFTLNSGDVLLITGANGSGKSTLLKTLTGLLQPDFGTINFRYDSEKSISSNSSAYAALCHYLGHQNALKHGLTPKENLQLHHILQSSQQCAAQINALLKKFHLLDKIHCAAAQLSFGQKRRLAFCRFLLNYKPIWVLDEPFTGLDKEHQILFEHEIKNHLNEGGIAIISTHHELSWPECAVQRYHLI